MNVQACSSPHRVRLTVTDCTIRHRGSDYDLSARHKRRGFRWTISRHCFGYANAPIRRAIWCVTWPMPGLNTSKGNWTTCVILSRCSAMPGSDAKRSRQGTPVRYSIRSMPVRTHLNPLPEFFGKTNRPLNLALGFKAKIGVSGSALVARHVVEQAGRQSLERKAPCLNLLNKASVTAAPKRHAAVRSKSSKAARTANATIHKRLNAAAASRW